MKVFSYPSDLPSPRMSSPRLFSPPAKKTMKPSTVTARKTHSEADAAPTVTPILQGCGQVPHNSGRAKSSVRRRRGGKGLRQAQNNDGIVATAITGNNYPSIMVQVLGFRENYELWRRVAIGIAPYH